MADTEHIKPIIENKKQGFKRWEARVTVISVIVSIILSINSLVKDDTPSDRLTFMYSKIHEDFVNGKMHTSFFVTVNNAGKTSFKIKDKVRARIWYIPIDRLTKGGSFDWQQYTETVTCNSVSYTSSYIGKYAPGDSVINSFDFFTDSINANVFKYTILVLADANFVTTNFLLPNTIDSEFCYYALIRYKIIDSASSIRKHPKTIITKPEKSKITLSQRSHS